LLFVIKDVPDANSDRLIGDHVLRMHRYRNPTEQDGEPTPIMQNDMVLATGNPEEQKKVTKKLEAYEKHDPLLHGRLRTRGDKVLSMEFIKKYIAAAKTREPPTMTPDASKIIAEEYTKLRSVNLEESHQARTQPITARSLETMIRLAAAHAKARFSPHVTKEDAEAGISLIKYAIFEKVQQKERKRKVGDEDNMSESEDEDADLEGNGEANGNGRDASVNGNSPKRVRPNSEDVEADEVDLDAEDEGETERMDTGSDNVTAPGGLEPGEIEDYRYTRFKSRVSQLFEMEREESLAVTKIVDWMTDPRQGFTRSEVFGGLAKLEADRVVMIAEGQVFLAT